MKRQSERWSQQRVAAVKRGATPEYVASLSELEAVGYRWVLVRRRWRLIGPAMATDRAFTTARTRVLFAIPWSEPEAGPDAPLAADQTTYEQREAQFTTALPDQRAQVAIRTVMAQIGLPYVWGGDGPTNGDAGFDCSGLTTFAYAAAGVSLPRTAHTQ